MSQGTAGGHRWRAHAGGPASRRVSIRTQRIVWSGLLLLLGMAITWLVLKPRLTAVKPTHIVAIGMTYDDPVFRPTPFAQQSADAFDELHERDKIQFPDEVYKHTNQLEGARLLNWGLPPSEILKERNLLVYLNLQGVMQEQSVDGKPRAAVCFLTEKAIPNAGFDLSNGQRVTARELLIKLGKLSEGEAANVIALLEVGDCRPNWRVGVLNRDPVAQLQKEAEAICADYPKLRIIGAASAGQSATASITHGEVTGRTTLAHFVIQGLSGEANGWSFDPTTGKSTLRTRDKRVSFDELFAYLNEKVNDWSVKHRGQRQNVWRVPAQREQLRKGNDLELVQIRRERSLEKLADSTKSKSEDSKVEEASARGSVSGSESSKKESSAATESSKNNVASKSEDPATKKSTDGDKKGEGDGKKSGDTLAKSPGEKDSEPKGQSDNSENQPTAAEMLRVQRGEQQKRILDLWRRRDAWRADEQALAAWLTPREWRHLQLQLVHAEQCWRAGHDAQRIHNELLTIEETFGRIDSQRADLEALRQQMLDSLLSLGNDSDFNSFQASAVASPPLTMEEQTKLPELLKEAFPTGEDAAAAAVRPDPAATSPKPTPGSADKPAAPAVPQSDELRSLVKKYPALRSLIWQKALAPAMTVASAAQASGKASAEDFSRLGELVDKASWIAGVSSMPAELIATAEISDVARASLAGEFDWTVGLSRACGQSLELRVKWERTVSRNWAFQRWLGESLADVDLQLVAAERWLRAGQADMAMSWLDKARVALEVVDAQAQVLQRAVRLHATLSAELPEFARWVARRLEAGGTAAIPKGSLRRYAESSSAEDGLRNEENLRALRDSVSEPSLFAVWDLIEATHELRTLLAVGTRDQKPREQTAPDASQIDFARLTERLGPLQKRWMDFRDGVFGSEVARLVNDQTLNSELWNQIDELLLMPWLQADERQRLMAQLERLDRQRSASQSGIRASSEVSAVMPVRGEWQAFWAIATLRLAGIPIEIEKKLWAEFSNSFRVQNSDDEDISAEYVSSVRLGSTIGQAFQDVAKKADEEPTEILVRGADGADLPSATARAWFASTVRQEIELAFRNRAAQISRFAKLDDDGAASRLAALAARWVRLVGKPSELSSEWAPLTVRGLTNHELWWSKGADPELKLSLTLAHRTGEQRAPGILRVLDPSRAVEIRTGTDTAPPSTGEIPLKAGFDPLPLPLRLLKRPGTSTQDTVTLAALDKETMFPWEIRRLKLRVPSKAQDWRIEFRMKDELNSMTSNAIGDRNIDNSRPEKYRTELLLPTAPREQPIALHPVLMVVNDTKVPSVTVTVYERDENGRPKSKPLGKLEKIPLASVGEPIPLKFPPPMPPAIPATTTAAAATGPRTSDISRGLIFQITTNANEVFEQHVLPRVRPPETYFKPTKAEAFQVTFRDLELRARLRRDTAIDEQILPAKVRVELVLPPELRALNPNFELVAEVPRGGEGKFFARFDERHRAWLNQHEFTIYFQVAGWPRAFPWRIRHDSEATLQISPHPTIVSPQRGRVIRQGDPLPVEIQVDSDLLNREGLDQPWTLKGELINAETKQVVRPEAHPIVRSREELIEFLGFSEEGLWQFAASVRDHRLNFSTDGLKGRYSVEIAAEPPQTAKLATGSGRSDPILVAVAPPDHGPPKPRLTVSPRPVQAGGKQDWRVQVDADDPGAGIQQLAIGFDTDGDGKLGEKEFLATSESWKDNPLEPEERRGVTLVVPAGKLPKTAGNYPVLVSSQNGVGNWCVKPLEIELRVEKPQGTVIVQIGNLGTRQFTLVGRMAGGKNPQHTQNISGNVGNLSVKLPIGEYEFSLQRKSSGATGPAEKVVVVEGEPVTISLDPSLVP